MNWTSWKPNSIIMNKTKQTKERKREGVFSRVTFYPVGVLFDKSFNELLCILIKMFGRECIKYDNGNLSSNFWIGSASTSSLSLSQMLPSTTLLFKHKMHLNLLLEWNCGIRRFLWQIAFNSANGRFCITLYKSKIYDSFQLFIFSWNGQKQIQCFLSSSLPYFFFKFPKIWEGRHFVIRYPSSPSQTRRQKFGFHFYTNLYYFFLAFIPMGKTKKISRWSSMPLLCLGP